MKFAGAKVIPSLLDGRVVYSVFTPDGIISQLTRAELQKLARAEVQQAADRIVLNNQLDDLYRMS